MGKLIYGERNQKVVAASTVGKLTGKRQERRTCSIVILSEVSQIEKDKYHMISLICGIQKRGTNELIYKTEIELQM